MNLNHKSYLLLNMRILGINLPDNEKVDIGLTRIYGIGRKNVVGILKKAGLDNKKRIKDLTNEEIAEITKVCESIRLEGDLRKEENDNIERLKTIRCFRGLRHIAGLPVRGQRTKTNARTRRGKKKTVGALTKEMWAKLETQQKAVLGKK